jgi:hypothetical protein
VKRTALDQEGLKIEPRLARTLTRAQGKMRASVPVYELMVALQKALQKKNVNEAMALFTKKMIRDALEPSAKIVSDASLKGAKLAAREINNRRKNGK